MNQNNKIFNLLVSIVLSLFSLFSPWYVFEATRGNSLLVGKPVTTSGLNGATAFFDISISHWLLIGINIMIAGTLIAAVKKIITVSTKILVIPLLILLAWGLGAVYLAQAMQVGGVKIGLLMYLASVIVNIITAIKIRK